MTVFTKENIYYGSLTLIGIGTISALMGLLYLNATGSVFYFGVGGILIMLGAFFGIKVKRMEDKKE